MTPSVCSSQYPTSGATPQDLEQVVAQHRRRQHQRQDQDPATSALPGKFTRARTQAAGRPTATITAVASEPPAARARMDRGRSGAWFTTTEGRISRVIGSSAVLSSSRAHSRNRCSQANSSLESSTATHR